MALSNDDQATILAWAEAVDGLDYYTLLGLERDANSDAVESAFHRFALSFHPDVHRDAPAAIQRATALVFQRAAEAQRVLRHPTLRLRYNRALLSGQRRLTDSSIPPPLDLAAALPQLHLSCRSAGAKLESQQAARAFTRGDLERARHCLERALGYDGGASPDLSRCLEALETLPASEPPRDS